MRAARDLYLLDALLAELEEGRVPDGARLNDLRDARAELPLRARGLALREAVEEAHVHEDDGGLVEGAHEVLAVGRVDGRLARGRRG